MLVFFASSILLLLFPMNSFPVDLNSPMWLRNTLSALVVGFSCPLEARGSDLLVSPTACRFPVFAIGNASLRALARALACM